MATKQLHGKQLQNPPVSCPILRSFPFRDPSVLISVPDFRTLKRKGKQELKTTLYVSKNHFFSVNVRFEAKSQHCTGMSGGRGGILCIPIYMVSLRSIGKKFTLNDSESPATCDGEFSWKAKLKYRTTYLCNHFNFKERRNRIKLKNYQHNQTDQ